jgi:CRISPR-associated protein Cas5t
MIALKLQLYQNMINYRKENSFGYIQSYPLPTPSMVRGMAHSLLGLEDYNPLKISIQGSFDSVCVNVQKVIKFDRKPKDRPNNPYRIILGSTERTATHSIAFVDCLVNCKLLLHIAFDDEKLTEELYKKVLLDTVVLGRNEDIARVDFKTTRIVEFTESNDVELKYPMYLDVETAKKNEVVGTHYKLPFCYQNIIRSFDDLRIFEFVDCVYVSKGKIDNIYADEDKDAVCFLEVNK